MSYEDEVKPFHRQAITPQRAQDALNWNPETKSYEKPPSCKRCGGSGVITPTKEQAKGSFMGAATCPDCKGKKS